MGSTASSHTLPVPHSHAHQALCLSALSSPGKLRVPAGSELPVTRGIQLGALGALWPQGLLRREGQPQAEDEW